jgi:uncharacterized membrane protein YgaE (UPF0421/DUF939 family)
MIIDRNKINWTKIQSGVKKYTWIMKFIEKAKENNNDLTKEKEFRKTFNGFYRIRQKPEQFYNKYYFLLNANLKSPLNFINILENLYSVEQRLESSFSSKLLHTINPDLPIWDSIVMEKLKLKTTFYSKEIKKKKEQIITQYQNLSDFFNKFIITPEGQELINLFDDKIDTQDYNITPLKKIDFIIWQTR